MVNRAGTILHFIYEGILVTAVENHAFLPSVSIARKLEFEFYPQLEATLTHLNYWTDKCLFEREGEAIARKNLYNELLRIWALDPSDDCDPEAGGKCLRLASNGAFGNGRDLNFRMAAQKWLSKFHSDYRWIVYTY